jgi:hypothetical protein
VIDFCYAINTGGGMSDLTEYLSLKSQIRALERRLKNAEAENSRLRKLCNLPRKKGLKKSAIMALLATGMVPKKIAVVVPCSLGLVYEYKKALKNQG